MNDSKGFRIFFPYQIKSNQININFIYKNNWKTIELIIFLDSQVTQRNKFSKEEVIYYE